MDLWIGGAMCTPADNNYKKKQEEKKSVGERT